MEIPSNIKRRYKQIDVYVETMISNREYFYRNIPKETYIQNFCHVLSIWFFSQVPFSVQHNIFKDMDNHKKVFIYLFRTKLSIAHEILTQSQDNNKKIIYSTSVENPSVFNTTTNTDINIAEILGHQP